MQPDADLGGSRLAGMDEGQADIAETVGQQRCLGPAEHARHDENDNHRQTTEQGDKIILEENADQRCDRGERTTDRQPAEGLAIAAEVIQEPMVQVAVVCVSVWSVAPLQRS